MGYEILKDIIVPALAPLVAVMALVFAARLERQKFLAQREHDLQISIDAAEREVLFLREAYQLIGLKLVCNEPVEPERIKCFEESVERFFNVIHGSPAIYEGYFSKNKKYIKTPRLPLLISELEIKLRQLTRTKKIDDFVLFALYLLIYARKNPGSDSEEIDILNKIYKTNQAMFEGWWNPNT